MKILKINFGFKKLKSALKMISIIIVKEIRRKNKIKQMKKRSLQTQKWMKKTNNSMNRNKNNNNN